MSGIRGVLHDGDAVVVSFLAADGNDRPAVLLVGFETDDGPPSHRMQVAPGASNRIDVQAAGPSTMNIRVEYGGTPGKGRLSVTANGDPVGEASEKIVEGSVEWLYTVLP